jgi:hypothetical protein
MTRWIMAVAATLLLASPLAATRPVPWVDNFGTVRSDSVPKKVRKFVIDAQACAHFSGELSGDNSERDRDVQKQIKASCTNLEKRRAKLLARYKGDAGVETIIAEVWEPFL